MRPGLKDRLEALYVGTDMARRLRSDPVAFPHRYQRREDIEIAALLASQLAYGRVSLFWPILEALFAQLDAWGGPAEAVARFEAKRAPALALSYRFHRPADFALLLATLNRVLAQHGSLEQVFSWSAEDPDVSLALDRGSRILRRAAEEVAPTLGISTLSRGFQYFLCTPTGGSACKRGCMFLRWMVRPPTEGVDFGLWRLPPAHLVIPLDTHVLRISRFLGLTSRKTGSWRTAVEITQQLARFDGEDPVRYDFAIAHLGISGACLGARHAEICPGCPLDPVCAA